MFERETVVGSNATSVFHWGSSSLTRLVLSASTTACHAKWIARKCLLLFNFYVTSIKYHKPLHLDDMVLKLSNLFTLWRWSGSGNKERNTHACYWNTVYTHQSQMSQDSLKAASLAFLQLPLLLHWLAKCQKYIFRWDSLHCLFLVRSILIHLLHKLFISSSFIQLVKHRLKHEVKMSSLSTLDLFSLII